MKELRHNTAAVSIRVGPFLDSTDGVTPETGLTIVQADVRLSKNGGAGAQKTDTSGGTHDEFGYYTTGINTTDNGTLGRFRVTVNIAGALPVWEDFMVVSQQYYDAKYGSSKQQVDLREIGGVDITSGNGAELRLKNLSLISGAESPLEIKDTGGFDVVHLESTNGGDVVDMTTTGAGRGVDIDAATAALRLRTSDGPTIDALATGGLALILKSDGDVIELACTTAGGNVLVATAGSAGGDCFQLNAPADAGKALDLNGGPVTGKGLEADGGGADIDAQELVDILADTAEIGTAGAGLTDLGGMSTGMKAEVQSEVDDALLAYDEAAGVASAAVLDTVLDDTDEMQGKLPTNNIMGSSVKTDKDDEIDAILVDTAEIGIAGIGLTDLGGMSSAMKAEVNAEVDTALDELIAEPVVGAPAVTCSIRTGMARVYSIARNKGQLNGTAGEKTYFNSSGVAISKKAVSDSGTTYEESAMTGV